MLTQRKKQRRTLVQEAGRASGRVASQARDMAGGAGDVARTARTEMKGLRKHARLRAHRRKAEARHVAAARLQDAAAKLSSAADTVENGRNHGRRWPRVALVVGAVVAAGLVVAKRARSMWSRDQVPSESAHADEPGAADRPERTGTPSAQTTPSSGGVDREKVKSGASSGRNSRNDGLS